MAIPLLVCSALTAAQAIATPAPASTNTTPDPRATTTARSPLAAFQAVVDQPRLTGYFVGDLLTQRVLLQRDGHPLTPTALPANGRVSAWFERRSTTITTDAAQHRWLVVEYQILNAPPKLTNATLPAWQLTIGRNASGSPVTLQVPAVSINIAPLSLPGSPAQVGTRDLRPDRVSPAIPVAPIQRAIALSSGALVLTLIAWLAWAVWRNRRAIATQPFARALREIRSLGERDPSAWQALHRAFDRTAGRVIQSTTLPALFAQAPQLTPARPQIEEFFRRSNLLFFGSAATNGEFAPARAPSASDASTSDRAPPASLPHALCAELRSIERRHES